MINNFDFFPDHRLHSNLISEQHRSSYLNIPVCASSWGKTVFFKAKFRANLEYTIPNNYQIIVFLRDPIDRWLSGLATWLGSRLPQHTGLDQVRNNQFALDLLFDSVCQDEHTERQSFFLHGLDTNQMLFWWIDSTFHQKVNQYFAEHYKTDISDCARQHVSTLDSGKLIPREYFREVLESKPRYLRRIKEYFYQDYQLIKKLRFHNSGTPKMKYYDEKRYQYQITR